MGLICGVDFNFYKCYASVSLGELQHEELQRDFILSLQNEIDNKAINYVCARSLIFEVLAGLPCFSPFHEALQPQRSDLFPN